MVGGIFLIARGADPKRDFSGLKLPGNSKYLFSYLFIIILIRQWKETVSPYSGQPIAHIIIEI